MKEVKAKTRKRGRSEGPWANLDAGAEPLPYRLVIEKRKAKEVVAKVRETINDVLSKNPEATNEQLHYLLAIEEGRTNTERALMVQLVHDDAWERFKLMDGNRCVYQWSDKDRMGEELANFLGLDLIPLLHRMAGYIIKRNRASGGQGSYLPELIKEEAARLASKLNPIDSRNFNGIVHLQVLRTLRRLADKPGSDIPERLRLRPTVTRKRVDQVLSGRE